MKKMIFVLTTLIVSVSLAQTNKEVPSKEEMIKIEERMTELEEKQKSIQEWYSNFYLLGKGRMSPFLGEKLIFGGFLETAIAHVDGPDTRARTAAYDHSLGIKLDAQLTDNLKLVAQYVVNLTMPLANPHNNPAVAPSERAFLFLTYGAYLREGYVEIKKSDALAIQTGIGPVPFGVALQINNPYLFYSKGGPQMTTYHDAYSISAPLWMGIKLLGHYKQQENVLGYNLYTFTPPVMPNNLGLGSRFWWEYAGAFAVGVSMQNGRQQDKSFFTHGVDLQFKHSLFGVTAEYAFVNFESGNDDIESYYLEPYVKFAEGRWLYYIRGDYLSYPGRRSGAVADPTKQLQIATGFNYLPMNNVRFRLGYILHEYIDETDTISGKKRDYNRYEFSAVAQF